MSLQVNNLVGFGAIVAAASSTGTIIAGNQGADSTNNQSSYTINLGIGTASSTRKVIASVCVQGAASNYAAFNSVTIGGVTAASVVERVQNTGNRCLIGIFIADVPTGTTADIVITPDQTSSYGWAMVTAVSDLISNTAHDTDSVGESPIFQCNWTVDIPASGIIIANVGAGDSGSPGTNSWSSNVTQLFDTAGDYNSINAGANSDSNIATTAAAVQHVGTNNGVRAGICATFA